MKIIVLLLVLGGCIAENDELLCQDKSSFCSHIHLTCQYFQKTRDLCPRTCATCSVDCTRTEAYMRQKCGTSSTTKDQCLNLGCCWKPINGNTNYPWCFKA